MSLTQKYSRWIRNDLPWWRSDAIRTVPLDRGHSSVGRALAWHARGPGFESRWLHYDFLDAPSRAPSLPAPRFGASFFVCAECEPHPLDARISRGHPLSAPCVTPGSPQRRPPLGRSEHDFGRHDFGRHDFGRKDPGSTDTRRSVRPAQREESHAPSFPEHRGKNILWKRFQLFLIISLGLPGNGGRERGWSLPDSVP